MSNDRVKAWLDKLREGGAHSSTTAQEESPWTRVHIEHINQFNTPATKRPGLPKDTERQSVHHAVNAGELPPWGQMDDALMSGISPVIPLDWKMKDDSQPTLGEYTEWLIEIIKDINALIWPIFRPGAWTDATVGRLLAADFSLLANLRWYIGVPISGIYPTTVQHGDLFSQEDDRNISFGTGYDRYDPTLPPVMACLPTVLTAGIVDKVGSLDLQLKLVFQRPRAYQVAVIQGRDGFTYQSAATANSPSLVSGHCLQASIAGCTAFAAFASSSELTAMSIGALQQFTVDVGDRRVFAGVHYPSDNLSSWYTALKLVPRVFESKLAQPVRNFLWEAINLRSVVFAEVKRHIEVNPDSPYRAAVEAIKALAVSS